MNEMKNANENVTRMFSAEERICELEERNFEIIKENKDKRMKE